MLPHTHTHKPPSAERGFASSFCKVFWRLNYQSCEVCVRIVLLSAISFHLQTSHKDLSAYPKASVTQILPWIKPTRGNDERIPSRKIKFSLQGKQRIQAVTISQVFHSFMTPIPASARLATLLISVLKSEGSQPNCELLLWGHGQKGSTFCVHHHRELLATHFFE